MKMINTLFKSATHHIGNFFRAMKVTYLRCAGVKIGRNTEISFGAKIDIHRGRVIIGDNCSITYGCVILAHDGFARQIDPNDNGEGTVVIGNHVLIGVNSVVLPNVTIGDNTVIGAGSVVDKDIPPNVIAMGYPIRVVKHLKNILRKDFGQTIGS